MVNVEKLLIKVVAELKISQFDEACKKAGLTEEDKRLIVLLVEELGE